MDIVRWTVGDLTHYIAQMFKTDYRLHDIEVEGEVSNWRVPRSGHAYFTLKDEAAQLKCVMWRSGVQSQSWLPDQGDAVVARGRMSVYEAGGDYQLYCEELRPAGLGDLHAQFEALKAKLEAEGLFDLDRKQPIPAQPRRIGIVTSLSTAALQDVLNVLSRRNPLSQVVIADAAVQGDHAPPQIIDGLRALNAYGELDVILLVRGGGSLEDLWCFNDEGVVRAVADSRLPVVTGVGHEIDFTLVDFASDQRAPTPSAAAELVTAISHEDRLAMVVDLRRRLVESTERHIMVQHDIVDSLTRDINRLSPQNVIDSHRQQIDTLVAQADRAVDHRLSLHQTTLNGLEKTLHAVSPQGTLKRGYAIVYGADGQVIRQVGDAPPGTRIRVQVQDGRLQATVDQQDEDQ